MPDEQNKKHSKISLRIGNVQVELEGTYDNIKKLMDKELYDFAKGLEETSKSPPSTETAPKIAPKAPEVTPKEKTVPPPTKPSITQAPAQTAHVPTPAKTTEKKSKKRIISRISRNAAIALVLVLVLLASLVSVIAIYVPMVGNLNSQIAEKDHTIASLNSQLSAIQFTLSAVAQNLTDKDNQIAALSQQVSSIEDNVRAEYEPLISDLTDITTLSISSYLLQNHDVTQQAPNTFTDVWADVIQYAGYIKVDILSTSNTTYVRLTYEALGVNFDQNVTLGESGTATFPVLPTPTAIGLSVGNTELVDSVDTVVTALYVY